jgi:Bacterial regulatory proteins, luxR family
VPIAVTAYTPDAATYGDRSEAAAAVAAGIAQRATGRDGGAESFLIARLLALSARASTEPADISGAGTAPSRPAHPARAPSRHRHRPRHSNADIAAQLHMGLDTVEAHVSRLLAKLGAENRVALLVQDAATSRPHDPR